MDTLTQVERLIELAIIQRSELRRLVEELPQLKTHLSEEIERTFEETEPQLRAELEEWTTKQTADKTAALGVALEAKIADLAKSLEVSTQARYNAIIAERAENARLAAQAEAKIAEHAASLPGAVKEIVSAELARFPRAGEIDQLRKEFAEPKSLNPRGKWVAGETYNKLDLVTINGDSYVSNIDGNTEKPSRSAGNWTLNAARGNSGGGGGITALNDLLGNPSAGDIVGSEGNNYVRKTLTAGTGITITDDPSTITIDASGAQEMLTATVKNAESVAITRGQVVYLFSATGGFPSVKLAYNTSDATSAKTFGVVSDVSIAPNGTGTITCVGVVSNLNLGAYNDGDTVYLGATPGSFTATKPYAPNHLVYVGIIERANAGNGELYVRIQNGYELDEIHDVQINNPRQAGQTLIYDATNSLWKNARLTAGVGVSITNADSSITISADGGVNYQGTWNASTNTPTLTSSVGTKGFYYVVSVAGSTNLNGVTDWKVGDWAIFNGTAWEKVDTTDQVSSVFGRTGAVVGVSTDYSSVGITNTAIGASNPSTGAFTTLSASTSLTSPDLTLGTSGPSVKSTLSARAPRQGLVFDGTANATGTVAAFGATDFSVFTWVNVTSFSSARSIIGGGTGAFVFSVNTSGALVVGKYGSADLAVSTSTLTAGKNTLVGYVRSGTTGTYYINGIAAGTTSDSYNYTAAISQIGANGGGSSIFLGIINPLYPYNRALSASEVVSLYEAGAPAGADYNGATNTAFTNGTFANVGYSTFSGASATGFVATYGGGGEAAATSQIANLAVAPGRKYLIKFDLTLTSGTAPYVGLAQFGVQWLTGSAAVTTGQVRAAAGANSIVVTIRSVNATFATNAGVGFASQEASSFTVSNLTATPLGLLLAPDAAQAGGGLVWYDTSGNAANITLPASGVSWNVPSSRVLGGNWTTSGNLTVSGTGLSSVAGAMKVGGTATFTGAGLELQYVAGGGNYGYFRNYNRTSSVYERLYVDGFLTILNSDSGGNVLIGTTTDGGQKLQVSGDIISTSTSGSNIIANDPTFNHPVVQLREAGTNKAAFETVSGDAYVSTQTAGKSLYLRSGNGTTALTLNSSQNATFAGNLTVSGTGGNTFASTVTVTGAASDYTGVIRANVASGYTSFGLYLAGTKKWSWYNHPGLTDSLVFANASGSDLALLTQSGNFLIGTAADSGNGKVQLSTHTTSAGGIGFGTDNSIYRAAAGTLYFDGNGTTALLNFSLAGLGKAQIGIFGGNTYFDYQGSLLVRYGGTTALTLDSSQNATFAGKAFINGSFTSGALGVRASTSGTNSIVQVATIEATSTGTPTDGFGGSIDFYNKNLFGTGPTIAGRMAAVFKNTGYSNYEGEVSLWTASNGTLYKQLTLSPGGGAAGTSTFAGPIAINNTVQTAVAAASTHKVTISIGGTTYYLLATNV